MSFLAAPWNINAALIDERDTLLTRTLRSEARNYKPITESPEFEMRFAQEVAWFQLDYHSLWAKEYILLCVVEDMLSEQEEKDKAATQ